MQLIWEILVVANNIIPLKMIFKNMFQTGM